MDQLQQGIEKLSISSKQTGFLFSEKTLLHKYNKNHVEVPARVESIVKKVKEYIATLDDKSVVEIVDDIDLCTLEEIQLVHTPEYVQLIEQMFIPVEGMKNQDYRLFSGDTYANAHTAAAARIAAKGTIVALENVITNKWQNAFAAIRPPGHHQGHVKMPNGFCIYNNVAIGAEYLRKKYNTKKICIVDWDIHHGDGTEHLTYNDDQTLYVSLHRYDKRQFYPCSGHPERVGGQKAEGFNVNIGWNVDQLCKGSEYITAGTPEYVYAYTRVIEPILKEFKPDLIIVSSGFDSAEGDPLGGCGVTPLGYAFLTEKLIEICSKVVVVLEGGYNLNSISQSAQAVFRVLTGERCPLSGLKEQMSVNQLVSKTSPNEIGIDAVKNTLQYHNKYWQVLHSKELIEYDNSFIGQESKFITGGHIQAFKVKGDKLHKKAKSNELKFYASLADQNDPYYKENQYLVQNKLIPQFFGIQDESIIMENLFHPLAYGSIIDIKLGTKTYSPTGPEDKRLGELKKSEKTTNNQLGLRMAGLKIKNASNEVIVNLHGSEAYTAICTEEQVRNAIVQTLRSNELLKPNVDALLLLLEFLDQLIDFIKIQSKRYFRSTSILLIVDNIQEKFAVKWIDFNYVAPLSADTESPDDQFDNNIMFGLVNLREMCIKIRNQIL